MTLSPDEQAKLSQLESKQNTALATLHPEIDNLKRICDYGIKTAEDFILVRQCLVYTTSVLLQRRFIAGRMGE